MWKVKRDSRRTVTRKREGKGLTERGFEDESLRRGRVGLSRTWGGEPGRRGPGSQPSRRRTSKKAKRPGTGEWRGKDEDRGSDVSL